MRRKINKMKLEKQLNKDRLKAIIKKVNDEKENVEKKNEQ
jgi:hypothetical protein